MQILATSSMTLIRNNPPMCFLYKNGWGGIFFDYSNKIPLFHWNSEPSMKLTK
jgi:hypothetical protein